MRRSGYSFFMIGPPKCSDMRSLNAYPSRFQMVVSWRRLELAPCVRKAAPLDLMACKGQAELHAARVPGRTVNARSRNTTAPLS